jgi:acyl-CoA thioesterase-1
LLLLILGIAGPGLRAAEQPLRILALGDSLTAGYGLAAADSFPAQLERALNDRGTTVQVLNAGVSGDTTAGGLARLEWALVDNPDLVILALGANDSLRAVAPEITRANLAAILEKLQARQLPVLLAGMYAPPNLGQTYQAAFDSIYPQLAVQYGALLYPFFLDGVATDPALNQADGIHPNSDGVAVLVQRIVPYVLRLIEQSGG